ncbi:MAG: polyprenyl synthetase family protein [Clostridia bacterium]|nr:polyprenyl synthetase family protein [Clostridia bacterium]
MADNFDLKYEEFRSYFNGELEKILEEISTVPQVLGDSMKYSLQLGGKRIRPVLMYAAGEVLGVERQKLTPFASALEFIHTYSLIHDDLPEMDNDDFRRGKPSNHKVYGAANAVLAGDGLLNTAYSILLGESFKGNEYISAAKFICDAAGIYGMIAGQSADILHEKDENPDEDTLNYIYENKTAKLLIAAVTVPSVLKGGAYYSELKEFGRKLGYLFQLTDDILDACGSFDKLGKTTGKDAAEDKLTAVKLYGIDGCRLRVDVVGDDCHKILDGLQGDVQFLHDLVNFVKSRLN